MDGISTQVAYIILFSFVVGWVGIGYFWKRKVESNEDFALAGRSIGFAMGTATVMATWVTANTILTAPEHAFDKGIMGMLGYGAVSAGVILFSPLAQRIKDVMPNGVTSGEFFRLRYGEKTWGLYFILSLAYLYAFLVTQAIGAGLVLNAVFGIPYHVGMIAITLACTIYTMMSGLKGVIGMDFINSILILAALVIIVPIILTKVGIADIYTGVMEYNPERLSALSPIGLIFLINAPIFSLGEIFHSNLWWMRAHALRKDNVRKSWIVGGVIWAFVPVIAGVVGLLQVSTGVVPEHLNQIFPRMTIQFIGSGGAFFITVLVLSSLASSLDSLLAGTSQLVSEDIYKEKINPEADAQTMTRVQQILIVFLAVTSIAFAWFEVGTMGQILYFSAAFVCSMIWPIIFGLYDKKVSAIAANGSMISGTIAGILTNLFITPFGGAIVSALVSLIVFLFLKNMFPDNFDFADLDPHSVKTS